MSDTSDRRGKRKQPDIDISTSKPAPALGWRGNVFIWVSFFVLFFSLFFFDVSLFWLLVIVPALIALFFGYIFYKIAIKRGIFTWMRLALLPARLMAQGDAAAAEAACAKALSRARQFAADDHRRGLMLCELAMFVKHQGRMAEALALYEESVGILAAHLATDPMDYFVALNNYGICFIHLKDYQAAQGILEKAMDLSLTARKREADQVVTMPLTQVQLLQFVLHLNLAFLFMEMHELGEAELQLRETDALVPMLGKRVAAQWHDHYVAMCALWEYESGSFANAEVEIVRATNPDYLACLPIRAKLHRVRQEFAQAEELMRRYQAEERKRGTLHRPELVKQTLEFAEALFGQGKHDDAFAAFEEARKIVADFGLPFDADWQQKLQPWLRRARELGKLDVVASLESELQKAPAALEHGVTILDKLRVKPKVGN